MSIISINTVVVGKNKKMGQNPTGSRKEIKQKEEQNEVYHLI